LDCDSGGLKNDSFLGRGVKNKLVDHKYTPFLGRGSGYLLYLHDLGVILSDGEESVNRNTN
jgi:hypothetical protein